MPQHVVQALAESPSDDMKYFFWNGTCKALPTVKIWKRTVQKVFELAKIPDQKAFIHNFRHSAATDLLGRGIPIEDAVLNPDRRKALLRPCEVPAGQDRVSCPGAVA